MRALPRLLLLGATIALAALVFITTAGSARPRVPGVMHLTMSIYPAGNDEQTMPANIAVRAGGTVTITFRNYTREFHTFTVGKLGLTALIRPVAAGQRVRVTSVTFVALYGVYTWHCLFCATHVHPGSRPMGGTVYAIIAA
jgi:hypothetical protein